MLMSDATILIFKTIYYLEQLNRSGEIGFVVTITNTVDNFSNEGHVIKHCYIMVTMSIHPMNS